MHQPVYPCVTDFIVLMFSDFLMTEMSACRMIAVNKPELNGTTNSQGVGTTGGGTTGNRYHMG